jgi:hypothetical protein
VSVDPSVEPDAWDQADLAWHGLFYLVLLFPAALMTFADPVTDRWPLSGRWSWRPWPGMRA